MTQIGIMIEGQEDLTWERWGRIARAVEDLGFESLFRSDHYSALEGDAGRAALALWPSLTALALQTSRIRFGPLVCSMTFRHPAELAKMAAAVDALSGGRLELGLGAGWNKQEHEMFGFAFPPYATRLEMLEEAAQVIKALLGGGPASFAGRHYSLRDAQCHPRPRQDPLPIIMGGQNEKRTLPLVAKYATEWNVTYISLEGFVAKSRVLDECCLAIGRAPDTLRRSLMTPFVIGRDARAVQAGIDAHRRMFPSLPGDLAAWQAAGYIGGAPGQVVEQLRAFAEAGIARFMLQHNEFDDLGALELLAAEVLPHFA